MTQKTKVGLLVSILYLHFSLPSFAMNDQEETRKTAQTFPKNSFSDETAQELKKILVLRQLPEEMKGHEFSNCGFKAYESNTVGYFLSKASHLTTLNLSENNFEREGLSNILQAIRNHTRLTELDISSNGIDELGGKIVLQFIQNNPHIKILKY